MQIIKYYEFTGQELYFIRTLFLKKSQQALANTLNCSMSLICLMENSERKITPEMSNKLVELLKQQGNYDQAKDGSELDYINRCLDVFSN